MSWSVEDIEDQAGREVIVTGANTGIGFETAKVLADKGAHVVLACRNQDKGAAALARIEATSPRGSVALMALDLADLASVKAFADAYRAEHDRLDLLINNAGVMVPPYATTRDGFELQFGTNHLGHFALTAHLLDLARATPDARIVIVSSIAHKMGRIDFDNLNAEKGYKAWRAYGQSKLANLLFARELARRVGDEVCVVAAHPGFTRTDLQRSSLMSRMMNPIFSQRTEAGAWPSLYAATAAAVRQGGYYGPQGILEMRGAPGPAKRAQHAKDDAVATHLWKISEELTGVSF